MKIHLTWPAEPHTRYAQSAFDVNIGKKINVNVKDIVVPATLLEAKVTANGSAAEFVLDVQDPAACVTLSAYIATGAVEHLTIADDQDS